MKLLSEKSLLRSIFLQGKYFLSLTSWERRQNFKFIILMILILSGFTKRKRIAATAFYNLADLPGFGKHLRRAILFDPKLARSILDPQHKGVKAWEYGMIVSQIPITPGLRILDIGTGNSAFPFYLASQRAIITCVDLPNSEQSPHHRLLKQYPHVLYDHGSMLSLPYGDNTFDVVLSISTIEHLQFHISRKKRIPYEQFIQNARQAISEMSRVLRPGGRMFITSDAYIPSLQSTDRYSKLHNYNGIGAAFRTIDLQEVFFDTLSKHGCRPIGKVEWPLDALINDINRSIYRGRYCTTFSVYAEKL